MSANKLEINLTKITGVLAILGALATVVGAWVILPYRLDAADARQDRLEARQDRLELMFHELRETLGRVDENVKSLKEAGANRR